MWNGGSGVLVTAGGYVRHPYLPVMVTPLPGGPGAVGVDGAGPEVPHRSGHRTGQRGWLGPTTAACREHAVVQSPVGRLRLGCITVLLDRP